MKYKQEVMINSFTTTYIIELTTLQDCNVISYKRNAQNFWEKNNKSFSKPCRRGYVEGVKIL